MTLALNKMAFLLATLIVLGTMLLGCSAAQAHVSNDVKAVERSAPLRIFAAKIVDHGFAIETERLEVLADVSVLDNRFDDPHTTTETSCCGNGGSVCSSGALALTPSVLLYPMPNLAVSAFSHAALAGIKVNGLMRPPRASV